MAKTIEELRAELAPAFEAYAERHGGDRPCVEALVDFLAKERSMPDEHREVSVKEGTRELWRGIHKVVEECGEVIQICGKISSFPDSRHPDGTDTRLRLQNELGDVLAAVDYLINENKLDRARIHKRSAEKFSWFMRWQLAGILVRDKPAPVEPKPFEG